MTTRELTPDEQQTALDLLREFDKKLWWWRISDDTKSVSCDWCDGSATLRDIDNLVHDIDCPIRLTTEFLAAVDSAQEAD